MRVRDAASALALVACIAGAIWTAFWSLRFGLAPRAPLSAIQIGIRIAIASAAAIALAFRRDRIERLALVCAIAAAGASAMYGLGYTSPIVRANRLLFHFLGYTLGAIAIARSFYRRTGHP